MDSESPERVFTHSQSPPGKFQFKIIISRMDTDSRYILRPGAASECDTRRWCVGMSWAADSQRSWAPVNHLRGWSWVGPENGRRKAFVQYETLPEEFAQSSSVCECPVSASPWRCHKYVYVGTSKSWSKRWVPCELDRESSVSFFYSGGSIFRTSASLFGVVYIWVSHCVGQILISNCWASSSMGDKLE